MPAIYEYVLCDPSDEEEAPERVTIILHDQETPSHPEEVFPEMLAKIFKKNCYNWEDFILGVDEMLNDPLVNVKCLAQAQHIQGSKEKL